MVAGLELPMAYFCGRMSLSDNDFLRSDNMNKSEIREIYKHRRSVMDRAEISALSAWATEIFTATDIYNIADTVMLYMPIGKEADTSAMMRKTLCDGKRVVLPVTTADGTITPVYADENTAYGKGAFSIPEPTGGEVASFDDIDVIIVPGLAFDKEGGRVGYGKGCYDRFLPRTNATKIGYCFDRFVCDKIDTDSFDIPVDFLLTESGIIKCR